MEDEYRDDRERREDADDRVDDRERDRDRSRDRDRERDRDRDDRDDRRSRSRSPRRRSRSRSRDRSRSARGDREREKDRDRERDRSRDRERDKDRDKDRDRRRDRDRDRDRERDRDRPSADRDRLDRERDRERAERNRDLGPRRTREDDLYRPGEDIGFRRRPVGYPRGGFGGFGGGGFGRGGGFGAPSRGAFGGGFVAPPLQQGFPGQVSAGGPMNPPPAECEAHARVSRRENRLYVGNLSYDCTYNDLSKFMSGAGGKVIFAEVLVTPQGTAKGCGIVEFETREQAQRAIVELNERPFMGRAVFIREDREENARFGAPPIPGRIGVATGESRNFGAPGNRHIFVGNLPALASWQDLKDLMRQAGEVIRADVATFPDGSPKGNGTVVFADPEGARAAIQMFNRYNWNGTVIEVREDRLANMPFRGGARGGFRGGFAGRGAPPFAMRGGFRGGFAGGVAAMGNGAGYNPNFTSPVAAPAPPPPEPATPVVQSAGLTAVPAEPSQQIWVRNLPWSTTNEDLVELFETVGNVALAEMLYEGEQSKGEGIVEFTETREAKEANERFMGYLYGGRPLDVQFNPRWHSFTPTASRGTHELQQ